MAAPLEIELSGGFSLKQGGLERLIRVLGPLLGLSEPRQVVIRLDRLVFLSPSALALLIAALKRVRDLGLATEGSLVYPPNSPPVRNYLMRMNLIRALVNEDTPEPFSRNTPHGFRPCQHFTGKDDYWKVASSLAEALAERAQTDEVARASVRICLDEIAENVVHHADTELGGFAAAQGWKKSCEFEIGIVDLGVGVRASLTKNPAFADIPDDVTATHSTSPACVVDPGAKRRHRPVRHETPVGGERRLASSQIGLRRRV